MSKQRYLLIILGILLCNVMFAGIQADLAGFSVTGNHPYYWNSGGAVLGTFKPASTVDLSFSGRFKASDEYTDQFPQTKHLNTELTAKYHKGVFHAQGTYRNILNGKPKQINLYPAWDHGLFEYRSHIQHQGILAAGADLRPVKADLYLIGKALYATPIEYVFDPIAMENVATERNRKSYEDIYSGAAIDYAPFEQLHLSAGADFKQANFDASDIYSINSYNLQASSEIKLMANSRISGAFVWQNRQGDNLPLETRNLFTGQIRFHQRLSSQLSGFISLVSNTCSDKNLDTIYLISNLARAQLRYTIPYDDTQDSYLILGGKYSAEHDANTVFSEFQSKITQQLYGAASFVYQPDLPDTFQSKLLWYFTPVSSFYLSYTKTMPELDGLDHQYLGIGTNIVY